MGDLKRVIDTNYPEWKLKTFVEALNIVGAIVREISNPAVHGHNFNQMVQEKDESV